MKNNLINECVFYTALWCLYYLQGTLYPSGGIISQSVLLVIQMLSIYYTFISFVKYNPPTFLKAVAVFLGMFVVYFLISHLDPTPIYTDFTMEKQVTAFGPLKGVSMSLLPIYAYYHFGRKGLLTRQNIPQYLFCFLVLTTIVFTREQNINISLAMSVGSKQEEFTNNVAYEFLQLFPLLVFLNKKPMIQYMALIYIMSFILLGMKRGAILIGIICTLYFIYQSCKSASRKQRIRIVALTIVALVVFSYFAIDFMTSSDYLQSRLEATMEGNTSGRNYIYSTLFEHMLSRETIGTILFGEGINHTVVIAGNYAHNDWLELGINMGFMGILVYICYFVALGAHALYAQRYDKDIYISLTLCIIITFASTLFSMSYNSLTTAFTMGLGWCLANYNNIKRTTDENLYNNTRLS